jgi:molybdopterin-guanine dinucleotide biosynthesis protein A
MLCGIFVGGEARRMGGQAKGLLLSPETGEPLVVRLARLASELGLQPVLVGQASAYRATLPTLRVVDDRPAGIGPLGGLAGLLAVASGPVLALACDLPHLSRGLLQQLVDAPLDPRFSVLALRSGTRPGAESQACAPLWQPLCARYDAPSLKAPVERAIARGVRSFQALFAELAVEELRPSALAPNELVDWDTPEDVLRSR